MRKLVLHPDNRKYLDELKGHHPPSCTGYADLVGMPVQFASYVPARDIKDVWHPPAAERFVSYGPEDECWARPLGLGTVERIDQGPAFWIVDVPEFDFHMPIEVPEFKPRSFLRYSF